MTTITPTSPWCRAMERAIRENVKPTKRTDGSFRVRSVSRPGVAHIVSVDESGHITECSDCQGWAHGGRQRPCKHAASVALAILSLMGANIATTEPAPAPSPSCSRGQIFRVAR